MALHRQPGQCLPLAGAAGRSPRRRDLPGLRRRGNSYDDAKQKVLGVIHRRQRPRQGRQREAGFPPRHGADRQVHLVRRRLPGGHLGKRLISHFNLAEGRDPQSYSIGIKELWDIDPAQAQARLGEAHGRLAGLQRRLWRIVPLSRREQPGGGRLRGSGSAMRTPSSIRSREFQRYKHHPSGGAVPGRRPSRWLTGRERS